MRTIYNILLEKNCKKSFLVLVFIFIYLMTIYLRVIVVWYGRHIFPPHPLEIITHPQEWVIIITCYTGKNIKNFQEKSAFSGVVCTIHVG